VTLLSYGFWIREKGWRQPQWLPAIRVDLAVAYTLTGLFGLAVMALAAQALRPEGVGIAGRAGLLVLASHLGERFGGTGEFLFLLGFWAAVASSLLGVWQGVPYLFDQTLSLLRRLPCDDDPARTRRKSTYRGFLLFMTFPPMALLLLERPVWLVIVYAALGALFMPFLAATLLVLGNRRSRMGRLKNGFVVNVALLLCLVLFASLMWNDLHRSLAR
jgi:Mn2+/Fe2+ NRAMP family transporter